MVQLNRQRIDYLERFQAARAFLEGAEDVPLTLLRRQMEASSDALDFERAALLRDKLKRLESLREQFARIRFALESLSFVYTVPSASGEDRAYVIRRGRVRADLPAPSTAAARRQFDADVARILAPLERTASVVPGHEVDEVLLVAGWFRKHAKELERTAALSLPEAAVLSA